MLESRDSKRFKSEEAINNRKKQKIVRKQELQKFLYKVRKEHFTHLHSCVLS